MTPINPADEFLKHAAESSDSRLAIWNVRSACFVGDVCDRVGDREAHKCRGRNRWGHRDATECTVFGSASRNRNLIIMLAARHKLPAVYFERSFVAAGGLLSYGPDRVDNFRRAFWADAKC